MIEVLLDYTLEQRWRELEDVIFNEDENGELVLQSKWYIFEVGTSRNDIWKWFDTTHSKGVGWLSKNIDV